mmetsp:Transcript_7211/g.22112  ORF Transcript_7211/g.22112 Transcript_7211/m.22112 type:complete len:218 (+) Transcript_7211:512-1165(+)
MRLLRSALFPHSCNFLSGMLTTASTPRALRRQMPVTVPPFALLLTARSVLIRLPSPLLLIRRSVDPLRTTTTTTTIQPPAPPRCTLRCATWSTAQARTGACVRGRWATDASAQPRRWSVAATVCAVHGPLGTCALCTQCVSRPQPLVVPPPTTPTAPASDLAHTPAHTPTIPRGVHSHSSAQHPPRRCTPLIVRSSKAPMHRALPSLCTHHRRHRTP